MVVEVRASPADGMPGQAVTFDVTVTDPDALVDRECNVTVTYGDGTGELGCATSVSCLPRHGAWTPPERQPDRYQVRFTHVYDRPGSYTAAFTFRSTSGACLDDPYGSAGEGKAAVRVVGE